jgi:hypothetical protein
MPQQRFDIGSKFLVQKQGRALLLLGGAKNVRSVKAMQAELVQQKKLPDGLLEVYFEKQKKPHHVLIEVATYPERRALDQALDDLTLARSYLRGKLPELLMIVLYPKGKFQIIGEHAVESPFGWAKLSCQWRVVELWKLDAADLLAMGDVGAVPLAPLARYDGPPEELLERCRERIVELTTGEDRTDLLAVSQVLAQLRFPQRELVNLLGGSNAMIESPLVREVVATNMQNAIFDVLKDRFAQVPREVRRLLAEVQNEKQLRKLTVLASRAESMADFKEHLLK